MAKIFDSIEITHKTRLCKVKDKIGYFHTWENYSQAFPASPMIGGPPAGIFSRVYAIVEFDDGHVGRVEIEDIQFCDEENDMLRTLNKAVNFDGGK